MTLCDIVDDNDGGWCPPSDNSGKIFVTVRRWTTDLQYAQPTYDDVEDFMRFLDKYVSHAVGNHYFMQWSKSNRTKTFLDKVTASDIAYTILVYENSNEVWKEELKIRATSRTDDERRTATREKKPRYHEGRGKRLKRYGDGWTDHGREYYQQLLGIFKKLKSSDVWHTLQDYWKLYQKKQYNKGNDNQDNDMGGLTKNATKATKKIGEWKLRITLSVMEVMT
jgi:hypothetical protein